MLHHANRFAHSVRNVKLQNKAQSFKYLFLVCTVLF